MFYRKCLLQCSELSTGQPILALANLFRKYLREFTSRVLVASLPMIGNTAGGYLQLPAMSTLSQLKDLSQLSQATTGILANFRALLKEGEAVRFSAADEVIICSYLVTVEYRLDTTIQLEEKMKQKVEAGLAYQINFGGELDMFHSVTGNCVGLLMQELECACGQGPGSMVRVSWSAVEQVGEQSLYVSQLVWAMRSMLPRLRDYLQTSIKYFTQFCIKFISNFIPKFISKYKPVGTVGAEQLLLDTQSLKTVTVDPSSLVEAGQVKLVFLEGRLFHHFGEILLGDRHMILNASKLAYGMGFTQEVVARMCLETGIEVEGKRKTATGVVKLTKPWAPEITNPVLIYDINCAVKNSLQLLFPLELTKLLGLVSIKVVVGGGCR